MKRKRQDRVYHPMSRRFADIAPAFADKVFSALSGDIAREQLCSLRNGDYMAVVSKIVDPSTFSDASSFADAYLACELMSKFPDWDLGIDRKQVAFRKFLDSEQECRATNLRLVERRSYVNGVLSPYTPEAIMMVARRKIRRLLGSFSWDQAERYFGFGPGATTSLKHRHGDAYFKYRAKPWTTRSNAVLAHTCISRVPQWFNHCCAFAGLDPTEVRELPIFDQIDLLLEITDGNCIVTVPKNAKTDRIIAIEPTMNSYVQSGIGGLIRSRLKRVGVDLDDQSLNQSLAKIGSETGGFATIDLSSASDTVSTVLVEELLPDDWVIAIKQARSPIGILPDGTHIEYQKVSSMGNGNTFELESLIFWALSAAVTDVFGSIDRRFAVYGDDIIVPTQLAHPLIWILNYCGFSCNMKKTFSDGPFRESCGKHYFLGVDVTPFYIREGVDTPERAIWLANQTRRYSRLAWGLDGRFLDAYNLAVSRLPSSLRRPQISDGYGDAALIGDFSEVLPQKLSSRKKFSGWEGWQATGHVRVSRTRQFGDLPYLVRQLSAVGLSASSQDAHLSCARTLDLIKRINVSGLEISEMRSLLLRHWHAKGRKLAVLLGSGVPLPDSVSTWRSVMIPVAQWNDYGPWLTTT